MKILFTGPYDPAANRVRVLSTGLRSLNVSVVETPYRSRSEFDPTGFHAQSRLFDLIFLPSGTAGDLHYISRIVDAPILLDITPTSGQQYEIREKSGSLYPGILPFHFRTAVRRADHLICDSLTRSDKFTRRFSINPDDISVLPTGTVSSHFLPSPRVTRKGRKKIGIFIREGYEQAFDLITSGISVSAESHLIHAEIYTGSMNALNRLNARKNRLSFPVTISLIPAWEALPAVINSFDLCIGPFNKGKEKELLFPADLLDFLSCGKPVLAMDNTASREYFTDGVHLVLCKADSACIARSINSILSDNEFRKELATEGMKLVRENFNEERIAEKFLELAGQVIR